MANKVSKEFLQEHFRKHDSITLYKPDGTPVTFRKQYNIMLRGGHTEIEFKSYDEFMAFYKKHHLSLKPAVIYG